jgi:predicted acylesterase/phospholipase RssA
MSTQRVDLVCEGGGVRGIGLVGAVDALAAAGYRFPRVAGTSAGAIVASLVAALQVAGEPLTRLAEIMRSIDYRKFLDRNLVGRVPLIGGGLSLLVSDGVYRGAYLEQLLGYWLAKFGVRTFGDLRTGEQPEQFAWSLVVTASDLSRRRLVRIPWDLRSYGINPNTFLVAHAVHASSAIPYVFEPVRVRGATWVDGGVAVGLPGGAVRPVGPALADVRHPAVGAARHPAPPSGAWASVVGHRRDRDTGKQSGQRLHRRSVHRATHHLRARRGREPDRLRHHRETTRSPLPERIAGGPTVFADLELRGLPEGLRRPGQALALGVVNRRHLPARAADRIKPTLDPLDVIRRRHFVRDPGDRHADIGGADRPTSMRYEFACDSSDLVVANAPT